MSINQSSNLQATKVTYVAGWHQQGHIQCEWTVALMVLVQRLGAVQHTYCHIGQSYGQDSVLSTSRPKLSMYRKTEDLPS